MVCGFNKRTYASIADFQLHACQKRFPAIYKRRGPCKRNYLKTYSMSVVICIVFFKFIFLCFFFLKIFFNHFVFRDELFPFQWVPLKFLILKFIVSQLRRQYLSRITLTNMIVKKTNLLLIGHPNFLKVRSSEVASSYLFSFTFFRF